VVSIQLSRLREHGPGAFDMLCCMWGVVVDDDDMMRRLIMMRPKLPADTFIGWHHYRQKHTIHTQGKDRNNLSTSIERAPVSVLLGT
jgi:hypothetical protein